MPFILTLLFCFAPLLQMEKASAFQTIPLETKHLQISEERKAHNALLATALDQDGYQWVASMRGLHVYDGNIVRPVLQDVLKGTTIYDLMIDRSNVLWVATNSGLLAYSIGKQSWRWHLNTKNLEDDAFGPTRVVFEDRMGNIWAGTDKAGVHRFEPSFDSFERLDILHSSQDTLRKVNDFCEGPSRDIWIATNAGLLRLTGNQGPSTRIPLSNEAGYSAKNVSIDGAGNLWVGMEGRGLWMLSASSSRNQLEPVPFFETATIFDLHSDLQGDMWIATKNDVFRYDWREQQIYAHPLASPSLTDGPAPKFSSISETSPGTFWIGTFNQGGFKCSPRPDAALIRLEAMSGTTVAEMGEAVCSYDPASQRVYVAPKSGGLFRSAPVDPDHLFFVERLLLEQILTSQTIKVMTWGPDGSLYCGLKNEVIRISHSGDIEKIQLSPDGAELGLYLSFEHLTVQNLACMPNGSLWAGTQAGLYSWHPGEKTMRLVLPTLEGVPNITTSGEILWFSRGKSVTVHDTRSGSMATQELPSDVWADNATIRTLSVDADRNLWIGNSRNVFCYGLESKRLTRISFRNGNSITNVLSMHTDAAGNLWLHTQDNVVRVAYQTHQAVSMVTGSRNPASIIASKPASISEAALAYGHTNGLLLVATDRLNAQPQTIARVSEVRVFEQPYPVSKNGRLPETIELTHEQNYITFTFSALELGNLRPFRFMYTLDGVDTGWNDAGNRNSVSYAHLAPGSYILKVRENASSVTTNLAITIIPPWWLTIWAKTGYVVAAVAFIFFGSWFFAQIQTTRIRKDMLENLVMLDPLTGIPNRRKFQEVLLAEKSRCKRSNHVISVIMVDIDYFKGFNDRFGHQAGDKALRKVAQTLASAIRRPEDFVARYGGEEFVLVLPSTSRTGAERVAQKIQEAIHEANIPYPGSPVSDRLTMSLGISTFSPQSDLHIDSGLFSADQALYQAKRIGRNCFFFKDHCLSLTPLRQ